MKETFVIVAIITFAVGIGAAIVVPSKLSERWKAKDIGNIRVGIYSIAMMASALSLGGSPLFLITLGFPS